MLGWVCGTISLCMLWVFGAVFFSCCVHTYFALGLVHADFRWHQKSSWCCSFGTIYHTPAGVVVVGTQGLGFWVAVYSGVGVSGGWNKWHTFGAGNCRYQLMEDNFKPGILMQACSHNLFFSTNVDQAILEAKLIFHVWPKFLQALTHMNPPPAPARTNDNDTGEQEAPHTCCGGPTQTLHQHPPEPMMTILENRRHHTPAGHSAALD
ncbi:hypothetical protein BS47DRAFT_1369413 [Hydnum rufescens UP504]|uniref:Uncharacterized protein n=1 Tax=Hydnum rufescens UP504 TaxID=1448309 RepID=A0A9P6DMJ2_9AGAM|nr:hypothetical protein BS47DRAFT_1369413 [Hydnum rufescens UP504]